MDLDFSVIIVNWNARAYLGPCLESIVVQTPNLHYEICVVDNASTDGSADWVRQAFPHVHVIANQKNLGFPSANNQGIRWAQGRYILLLNPDTVITDRALERMVAYLNAHPQVGIVGPRLTSPEGRVQGGAAGFDPSLRTVFNYHFFLSYLMPRYFPGLWLSPRRYADPRPIRVDWVAGACLMARSEAIQEIGGLDEEYFMYAEDVEWCRRFRAERWRVVCLPEARVVHHVGVSAKQRGSAFLARNIESLDLYYRAHYGPPVVTLLHLMGVVGFTVRYLRAVLRERGQDASLPDTESSALWKACLGASWNCLWRPSPMRRAR